MNGTKETRSYISEIKSSVDALIGTFSTEEEQKLRHIPYSKFEQIITNKALNFEFTAQSETIDEKRSKLIDIEGTNMIISDHGKNKFTIRNREDLSVIKTIEHEFGYLNCGLCYPEQKLVELVISNNLVEFDFETMKITKNIQSKSSVLHIEKVSDETFLTCDYDGYVELIKMKDLTCLCGLKLKDISSINDIENLH